MSEEQEKYDLESIYDEKIAPLMTEVLKVCQEYKIPMFASFAYRQSDNSASFCTSYLAFPTRSPEELLEAKLAITTGAGSMAPLLMTADSANKS